MAEHPWEELHADIYNALGTPDGVTLQARVVHEPGGVDNTLARPISQIMEDEVKNTPLALYVQGTRHEVTTDEEGHIALHLGPEAMLRPGRSVVTITPRDRPDLRLGRAHLTILPGESQATSVVSDIDLTYLNTLFTSTADKMSLVREDARSRVSFPGNPALYQGLRAGGASMTFLSGSPRFFKRVIEGKFQMDGVEHDALVLKPFKNLAYRTLRDFRPHHLVRVLKEQVGYKLASLLRHRLRLPPGTGEVLLGDDSEADFVSYHLYAHVLQGAWRAQDLGAQLEAVGVPEADRETILALAAEVAARVTASRPVRFIGIRATGVFNERFKVEQWQRPEMIVHRDALQLALALAERGHAEATLVARVRQEMGRCGVTGEELKASLEDAQERELVRDEVLIRSVRRVL